MLAYQKPNAKKLRRTAQRVEQLAAKGVVPRRQKLLLNRRSVQRTSNKAVAEANNNPSRDYYDIWDKERKSFTVWVFNSWRQPLVCVMEHQVITLGIIQLQTVVCVKKKSLQWQKCNDGVNTPAFTPRLGQCSLH